MQKDFKFIEQALPKRPPLADPEHEQIHWDSSKEEIFAADVGVWVSPHFLEGSHACSSSRNLHCDVFIIV